MMASSTSKVPWRRMPLRRTHLSSPLQLIAPDEARNAMGSDDNDQDAVTGQFLTDPEGRSPFQAHASGGRW